MKSRPIKKRNTVGDNEYFLADIYTHIFVFNKRLGAGYIVKGKNTYIHYNVNKSDLINNPQDWRKISESEFKNYCPNAKILGKEIYFVD